MVYAPSFVLDVSKLVACLQPEENAQLGATLRHVRSLDRVVLPVLSQPRPLSSVR